MELSKEEAKRYIPTPVGRFFSIASAIISGSVHPHACGEIGCAVAFVYCGLGTSPRLWGDSVIGFTLQPIYRYIPTPVGRFFQSVIIPELRRYIPTPVGRLSPEGNRTKFMPVHPHACGEISFVGVLSTLVFGTSPRLWGD